MNVYFLGREVQPGPKKFVDYYFVEKKTGKFLVRKKSDRTRQISSLHLNGSGVICSPTETEVIYTTIISTPIIEPTEKNVLAHIRSNFYNMASTVSKPVVKDSSPVKSKVSEAFVVYETKAGSKIQGTMEQVLSICKQIDETIDLSKLSGYDKKKYHYSESKKEFVEISEMNTIYLMNTVTKKIRDYFDNFKVSKEFSVFDFKAKLEAWTEDEDIQSLVEELMTRE